MKWLEIAVTWYGWYFVTCLGFVLLVVVVLAVADLLLGPDERDVERSGRWAGRVDDLARALRGTWTLMVLWIFAVEVAVTLGWSDTPTAGHLWPMMQGAMATFGIWLVVSALALRLRVRHSYRINLVTGGGGE